MVRHMPRYRSSFTDWLFDLEMLNPIRRERSFIGFTRVHRFDVTRKRESALFEVRNYRENMTCIFFLAPSGNKVSIYYKRKYLGTVPMDGEGVKRAWELFKEYCR